MPIPLSSQIGDVTQSIEAAVNNLSSVMRVAMPGIIDSFNPVAVTCSVRPAIKGVMSDHDGELQSTELPLLVDVPVVFPRGGGCTLTFPVQPGDECLLVFSDRCIDFWWQSSGVQEPVDPRQHDLSDAFAILGPQSQPKKIGNISTHSTQLRTDDGAAFIELTPANHAVNVVTSGDLSAQASGSVTITSPTITLNGSVTINGTTAISGPVTVSQDVTAGGKSLINHVHGGVMGGPGTTGKPL